jgi:predicted dehydrogenase
MNKKANIFLFGAGNIIEQHIKASKAFKEFTLFGIKGRNLSNSKKMRDLYKIKNVYDNYEEINIPKNKISIAIVGVNVENTYEVFKKIYNLFDICLLEKPAGYNLTEAKKIFYLSKKSNIKTFVSLNRRFFFSTQDLLNFISKDKSPRLINIVDTQSPKNVKDRFVKKVIDNWIFANSIHMIDYINIFCRGKLKKIENIFKKKNEIKVLKLVFTSGDVCIYNQLWNRPGPWHVSVSNTNGFYKLEPLEELNVREKGNNSFKKIKTNKLDLKLKPGFYNIYRNLSLFMQRKENNLVDLKKSLKLMQLISRIKKR